VYIKILEKIYLVLLKSVITSIKDLRNCLKNYKITEILKNSETYIEILKNYMKMNETKKMFHQKVLIILFRLKIYTHSIKKY